MNKVDVRHKLSDLTTRYLAHHYGTSPKHSLWHAPLIRWSGVDHPNPPHDAIPVADLDALRTMAESEVTFDTASKVSHPYWSSSDFQLLNNTHLGD